MSVLDSKTHTGSARHATAPVCLIWSGCMVNFNGKRLTMSDDSGEPAKIDCVFGRISTDFYLWRYQCWMMKLTQQVWGRPLHLCEWFEVTAWSPSMVNVWQHEKTVESQQRQISNLVTYQCPLTSEHASAGWSNWSSKCRTCHCICVPDLKWLYGRLH